MDTTATSIAMRGDTRRVDGLLPAGVPDPRLRRHVCMGAPAFCQRFCFFLFFFVCLAATVETDGKSVHHTYCPLHGAAYVHRWETQDQIFIRFFGIWARACSSGSSSAFPSFASG
jgi:hypothetical protein